jgi:hypothetical protein
MAQQGKQMRVGAYKGIAYQSVDLVGVAINNRFEVDSNTFFKVVKPTIHSKYFPLPTMTFSTHILIFRQCL